jgi:hypothetical protein
MKIRINGVTYTSIKKNSLAWRTWKFLKAVGYLIGILVSIFIMWAFVSFIILVLG